MLAYGIPRRFGWTKSIIHAAFLILSLLPSSVFAVNQNSSATYTIPTIVPPGTTGVVPRISLRYHKQARSDSVSVDRTSHLYSRLKSSQPVPPISMKSIRTSPGTTNIQWL
jgi:hypothetical protein